MSTCLTALGVSTIEYSGYESDEYDLGGDSSPPYVVDTTHRGSVKLGVAGVVATEDEPYVEVQVCVQLKS